MAIREVPAAEQRMDVRLKEVGLGSARSYTLDLIDKGKTPADIAPLLTSATGQRIAASTLYKWIRRWKDDGERQLQEA